MAESKEQQQSTVPLTEIRESLKSFTPHSLGSALMYGYALRLSDALDLHAKVSNAARHMRERHRAKAVARNFHDCGCEDCEALEPVLALAQKEG